MKAPNPAVNRTREMVALLRSIRQWHAPVTLLRWSARSACVLGAPYSCPAKSPEDLARHAIVTAAEFDDGTALPVTSHSIKSNAS